MQHSQPHVTLYLEVIFFSWVGKMLREVESLMMILLYAYLASLGPPSSGGFTMIICSSMSDTRNNNSGNNCGSN